VPAALAREHRVNLIPVRTQHRAQRGSTLLVVQMAKPRVVPGRPSPHLRAKRI